MGAEAVVLENRIFLQLPAAAPEPQPAQEPGIDELEVRGQDDYCPAVDVSDGASAVDVT